MTVLDLVVPVLAGVALGVTVELAARGLARRHHHRHDTGGPR